VDAAGEAAFYGPKLDLQVRDRAGHEETIATVQLDFNHPERFDLTYSAADGSRRRPVMIHRGTVGSMERVVAALLERYRGRLPLWLAPVQVRVLPVTAAQDDDAHRLLDDLHAAGVRAELDTGGSLAARVRRSRRRRDALFAVVGATETAGGTVQITDPATRTSRRLSRSELITAVRRAHASRAAQVSWPPPD
jgi:threonyl-tRNA synthetase